MDLGGPSCGPAILRVSCCAGSRFGMVEKVKVTSLEAVKDVGVSDWPSGSFLCNTIDSFRRNDAPQLERPNVSNSSVPSYWQACARWALLSKFGCTNLHPDYVLLSKSGEGSNNVRHVLQMSDADMAQVRTDWNAVLENKKSSELSELLSTSVSNGKELQWAVMECQAGCQFRLHAHPNLELVYCVTGSLFEIRRNNSPEGDWSFGTLNAGQWLVNETNSVHKSFTATNGNGCTLLVLWSGSHADLEEIQKVQDSVNRVDQKLNGCNSCVDWDEIKETFLPDSEKCVNHASVSTKDPQRNSR